jgi:(p)ppGpp synthase/HD superfamily hydrolase
MEYIERNKMANLSDMLNLAREAHLGQVDKAGVEYVEHLMAVAAITVNKFGLDDELVMIALGHDLLEDTWVTADILKYKGFSQRVIDGIVGITKLKTEKTDRYCDYKARVFANPDSMKVKWADLTHNLDISRLNSIDDVVLARVEKYEKFKAEIETILEKCDE